jgi:hypothetical protein
MEADGAAEGAGMSGSRRRVTIKALRDHGLVVEVEPRQSLGHRRLSPLNGSTEQPAMMTKASPAVIPMRMPTTR